MATLTYGLDAVAGSRMVGTDPFTRVCCSIAGTEYRTSLILFFTFKHLLCFTVSVCSLFQQFQRSCLVTTGESMTFPLMLLRNISF